MSREVRLWEFLRDGLKGLDGLHMRRVENQVSSGDPDVDGCYLGRYFEIELKGCDRPARGGRLDFDIRQSQRIWHRRRWRAGGNIWLYVRVGVDRSMRKYLISGSHTEMLRSLQESQGILEGDLARLAELHPDHTAMELLLHVRKGQNNSSI